MSGTVLHFAHWLTPPSTRKTTHYILYIFSQDYPAVFSAPSVVIVFFKSQLRHYGVPLSRTVFENQWTIWTVWTVFQNGDSGVQLSRSALPLRLTGRTCLTGPTDSQNRDSGVPLSGTGFVFGFPHRLILPFSHRPEIRHSGVTLSGTVFVFSFPSQYSQASQYSQNSQIRVSGVPLSGTGFQNRVSGVPLSGTVFYYRLLAHESYRPHRTYKPHAQIGHTYKEEYCKRQNSISAIFPFFCSDYC